MKKLYYLSERNGIWQLKDATTGKRESLKTTSKAEAIKLADAKYEGASDVRFNTRMAQTWLEKVDPKSIKRTWADVIDAKCKLVKGGTKERWERVKKTSYFCCRSFS